jgi:hypothetical protein
LVAWAEEGEREKGKLLQQVMMAERYMYPQRHMCMVRVGKE